MNEIGEKDWTLPIVLGMISIVALLICITKGGAVPAELAIVSGIGMVSTLKLGWKSFRNFR